jgi:hypothetical protein
VAGHVAPKDFLEPDFVIHFDIVLKATVLCQWLANAPDAAIENELMAYRAWLLALWVVASHAVNMLKFGFSTLLDLLSWVVIFSLGLKVAATLVLLSVRREVRDRPGWGSMLWWVTKITPGIAAPCVIWIAWLQGMTILVWLFIAVLLFVVVAVPLKIRQRRTRIANRTSATPFG